MQPDDPRTGRPGRRTVGLGASLALICTFSVRFDANERICEGLEECVGVCVFSSVDSDRVDAEVFRVRIKYWAGWRKCSIR